MPTIPNASANADRPPSLKFDGRCPQCGSDAVRSGANIEGKEGLRGGNRIPLYAMRSVPLDNYVCITCGYVERYINNRDALRRIQRKWPRVPVQSTPDSAD